VGREVTSLLCGAVDFHAAREIDDCKVRATLMLPLPLALLRRRILSQQ